jgi:prevent-host-death family protein
MALRAEGTRAASNNNWFHRAAACVLHQWSGRWRMKSVSQREMRNNSAELLRRVAQGGSVMVTHNGVPAAVIVPVTAGVRERLAASGRLKVGTGLDVTALPPPTGPALSTRDALDEDRGS